MVDQSGFGTLSRTVANMPRNPRPTTGRLPARAQTTPEERAQAVSDIVAAYSPAQIEKTVWKAVAPLVRQAVAAADPSPARMPKILLATALLAAWAKSRNIPLRSDTVFIPATIERFIAEGLLTRTSKTKATYRATLRGVGRAVAQDKWPMSAPEMPHQKVKDPYTGDELARLIHAISQNKEPHRSRGLAIVYLAAGAGAASADIRHFDISNDVQLRDDLWVVQFCSPGRERIVPVRRRYIEQLRSATETLGGANLLADADREVFYTLSRLRLGDDLPPLLVSRCRTSWLVYQMAQRVPLSTLLRAAGLTTARPLEDLVKFVPQEDDAWTLLAGDGK